MAVNNRKGQAILETVLLLPFIIVMIFLVYQAYISTNKFQIAQKYLKTQVLGRMLNRYEVTAVISEQNSYATPNDGKFFYIYNDGYTGTQKGMNVGLDKATVGILLSFMAGRDGKTSLEQRLTKGTLSKQEMGVCVGGSEPLQDQTSPAVFNILEADTCNKK